MVNTKGGKKFKQMKKDQDTTKKVLRTKQEDEEYGVVDKALGCCRFSIKCNDGKIRIGQLRSGMKKNVKINNGDWVLIGTRTFETQDVKCDILCKYMADEIVLLRKNGVLIESNLLSINNDVPNKENPIDENMAFDFDDI